MWFYERDHTLCKIVLSSELKKDTHPYRMLVLKDGYLVVTPQKSQNELPSQLFLLTIDRGITHDMK